MPDRHLIARSVLAGADATFSEGEWEDRKAAFHQTLCEQFPINKLRASVIEFDYEMKAGLVFICAHLTRSRQGLLDLRDGGDKHQVPFYQEVAMVERARASIRDLYESSLKSDADPSVDSELAHRRKQIAAARKAGSPPTLTIYTTVDGEDIPLDSAGRWLPHARMARVTFKIDGLSRRRCRVRVQSVILVSRDSDGVSTDLSVPTHQVDIVRDQNALGEAAGQVLSSAMERQVYLQSTILLEFSWVDGALARWTLCEVPTEASLDASNASAWQQSSSVDSEGEGEGEGEGTVLDEAVHRARQ